ncbi:MAG: hypothetical protein HY505_00170 [Candidatus Yanofskybacteria bacterium]|nr:hypothetical protein [Candidatus Yanofskybacteria bacterium]
MTEGRNLEQHSTATQEKVPEVNPEVDIESVLERGEITSAETLKGYFPIKTVDIKDDGKGIFRPEGFTYERLEKKENLRTELELLASSVNEVLGFKLVPPIVFREIEGQKGTLQTFVNNGEIADNYGGNWPEVVAESEILKAAVFDFLINAQDRHEGNFLVDPDSEKIWLIDHDDLMFLVSGFPSHILVEANKRGLTELSEEIIRSIQRLYDKVNYLLPMSTDTRIQKILLEIKARARKLVEDRKITV